MEQKIARLASTASAELFLHETEALDENSLLFFVSFILHLIGIEGGCLTERMDRGQEKVIQTGTGCELSEPVTAQKEVLAEKVASTSLF